AEARSPAGWSPAASAGRGRGAARRPRSGPRAGSAAPGDRDAGAEAFRQAGSARAQDLRRWRPGGAGRSFASRSLLDGVGLADGVPAPLDLDLDAIRVTELLVDLQRLVGAVHLVAVDAADHVAVLDPDLRVE